MIPGSHGRMLSQTLLVSNSVSFSACQLVKNRYRSGEKQVNPVQPSLQCMQKHSLQAMQPVELVSLGLCVRQTFFVDAPCCLWYLVCIAILSIVLSKAFVLQRIRRLVVSCAHVVTISQKSLVVN